jgi:hypothetical protein
LKKQCENLAILHGAPLRVTSVLWLIVPGISLFEKHHLL